MTHLVSVVLTSTKTLVLLVGQQLDISTTALETLLEFDLVLNDERLALGVNGFVEKGRDGMVSGLGLYIRLSAIQLQREAER